MLIINTLIFITGAIAGITIQSFFKQKKKVLISDSDVKIGSTGEIKQIISEK